MAAAAADDAGRDADRVGFFLRAFGLRATPEKPAPLPERFLLHLGAALRLCEWEAQGFFYHRAGGLPEAREALRDAFRSLTEPNADPTGLWRRVVRLSVERFAWHGRRDLDADVAVDDLIDEAALDALAEYLWASRRAEAAVGRPQQ
jgi:hypothetical protein